MECASSLQLGVWMIGVSSLARLRIYHALFVWGMAGAIEYVQLAVFIIYGAFLNKT